ncbi:unnamed protein product, partial [Rotaria socialis]
TSPTKGRVNSGSKANSSPTPSIGDKDISVIEIC